MMGLVCLAIGGGITGVGAFRIYLLIASASWQRTMGQVLESSAHQNHEMNIWPSIKYSYMVNGREYVNNRIYAGGMSGFSGWYQWVYDLLDQHPAGCRIPVFYDPNKPKRSCLKKGGWVNAIGLCVIGVGFL
ncbi:MAG: DUF3592 domain-containing protein [Syntrophobacteraceae bacterium]